MSTNVTTKNVVERFASVYGHIHAPCVLIICMFGCVANVSNVAVLTRKAMRVQPTNIILCGLSVAQLLLLANFLCYTCYTSFYDAPCAYNAKSYVWLFALLMNVNINLLLHTTALVLTVMLGVFRYVIIHFINQRQLISTRLATRAILCVFACVPVLCVPFYMNSRVAQQSDLDMERRCGALYNANRTAYRLAYTSNTALISFNFWSFGVVCKLVPCAGLVIVSALLIRELKLASDRQARLGVRKATNATTASGVTTMTNQSATSGSSAHSQTTKLLLVILCLFVSVEMPQGIMNVFVGLERSGVLFTDFRFTSRVYAPLGDFFEMLTVLYSAINFVLYCAMSGQFRSEFLLMLREIRDNLKCCKCEFSRTEKNNVKANANHALLPAGNNNYHETSPMRRTSEVYL